MGMNYDGKKITQFFNQKFSSMSREWASIIMKNMCKEKLLHTLSNNGDDNEHTNNNKNKKNP